MNRRGAALLLVLAAVVATGLGVALAHHAAVATLRRGRASLAALRAREAAAAGLASVVAGGPASGALPGGADWTVRRDTTVSGEAILWSVGRALLPQPATLEVAAVMLPADTTATDTLPPRLVQRWLVMRR